ncbi:hypothetical protein EOS93_25105 [Rhizobium sp. RMa-01]|uniref:PD-(D/E)XK nuclease-like domain-containing protein n=1 Tax=unclassified Rhizobium TaxID=2613769 RepID=UPI0008DA9EA0|nr:MULTISPECIES: PD-(D/E)XK nuclease-like domain-containing protein [unclassified Rhizobium]OHV24959.1 hypothetical protein BBJ66_22730 [Rhizobium sp. RSm-3]RVU08334.1 hypothetical protein EOS93_25105 [Rhizobium sp. RMa-01]
MNQIIRHDDESRFDKMIDLEAVRQPGIYLDIPNEEYHNGEGISKSGLWTIYEKTPAHYKFPADKEETTQTKAIKAFGTAAHTAILEPNEFDKRVMKGPDDRRGNKWKDKEEEAELDGKLLLVADAFDNVLRIRDALHRDPWINGIITGGKPVVEASGYFIDPITGELCRVRPDLWREDIGVIVDVKSTESAHPDAFARSALNYGYHAQEAFYTDGWNLCLEARRQADIIHRATYEDGDDTNYEVKGAAPGGVQGFIFIAWEKTSPHAVAVYELPPSIVDEGRAIMRRSLDTYAECKKANHWPAYADGVQELRFKRWAYKLTPPPEGMEEAA